MNKAMIYDGKNLVEKTWEKDSYDFIKTHVGGYIEHVVNEILEERNIDMWCNEDGKFISELEPTLALTCRGEIYDVIMGNVVFTRCDNQGNTIGLIDDDIEFIKNIFKNARLAIGEKGNVVKCLNYGKEDI